MGKHVKDYSSGNKSRSNLCKNIFLFEVLNIITEYWCTLIKTCAVCRACNMSSICVCLQSLFSCFGMGFFSKVSSLKLNIYCFLTISL